jgi:hypothetical protein
MAFLVGVKEMRRQTPPPGAPPQYRVALPAPLFSN